MAMLVVLTFMVPFGSPAAILFIVAWINVMMASYLVQSYQQFQIKMHLEEGGQKAPVWKTLLVVILARVVEIPIGFVIIIITELLGVI